MAVPLQYPVWSIIQQQLQEGVHIFLSQLTTMFYSRFPTIFLGFWGNPALVAIYNIGDKVARMTEVVLDAFMQALYPLAYQQIAEDPPRGIQYILKFAKIGLFILLLLGTIYCIFAKQFILLLTGGTELPKAVSVLRIHAFLPIFTLLANLLGIGILVPLKAGKKYTLIIALAGLFTAGLHAGLVPIFKAEGAAWSVLCSEIGVLISLGLIVDQTIAKNKNSLAIHPTNEP
jgi:PST family polysaccharide transporter